MLNYEYQQKRVGVIKRGVTFISVSEQARSLKAKWSKLFAASIDKTIKKEIHYEQFRWHIFSYEKLKAKTGDKARNAFDSSNKSNVYIF